MAGLAHRVVFLHLFLTTVQVNYIVLLVSVLAGNLNFSSYRKHETIQKKLIQTVNYFEKFGY